MKRNLYILIIILLTFGCSRHLLTETELKAKKEYRDISLGLNNPMEVYRLNLHMPDTLTMDVLAFKRLNELDIYKPKFNEIPAFIGRFKKLQTLIILDAEITSIPDQIVNLKNLRWLRLWNLKLAQLPSDIGNLRKLEILELFANDIRQLPQSITKLRNLKKIGIDNNVSLDFFDAFEKLAQLPNLTYLNLNYYPHDTLPSNFSKLQHLETVTLWNNKNGSLDLDDTFKKLTQLKSLKKIDLSGTPVEANRKQNYIDIFKQQCNNCEVIWSNY